MLFDPMTPEGLALLNEFCQVFAPLKYNGMSLARVLFYDYLRFLCNLPQLVERRRELGDLPSIPWARLQPSLVGRYPETCYSEGRCLSKDRWLPISLKSSRVLLWPGQSGGAIPPVKDLNQFRREMGVLHSLASHPIFGHPRFRRWFISLAEKAVAGYTGRGKVRSG